MTNLYLDIPRTDINIIASSRNKLNKAFKLTSYRNLNDAVYLATYLLVLGENEGAKLLLDSFIDLTEYAPEREDLWGSNGQGIVLRSYLADLDGNFEKRDSLIQQIYDNDILTSRTGRYELFLESLEEYEDEIEDAVEETKKYKCEIYAQATLTFLYFYMMLPFFKDEAPESFKQEIKILVNKCNDDLSNALNE